MRRVRLVKLIAVVNLLLLITGVQALRHRVRSDRLHTQRVSALPPAYQILGLAMTAGICSEELADGVFSLHRRGERLQTTVSRGRGSLAVSAVTEGTTEDEMDAAVAAYQASGQSPELYEMLSAAIDLGLVQRSALRC